MRLQQKNLVSVVIIYTQLFLLYIFLKFIASFVGCSLYLFNNYSKKTQIAYFSKLFCSTVFSRNIKSCHISKKECVAKILTGFCTQWKTFLQERF